MGTVPILHANGFFYTLTPQLVKKVEFVDINSFSSRGMGHVDCTIRCARARFTSETAPWDVIDSNSFISTTNKNTKVFCLLLLFMFMMPSIEKENIILQKNRI